MTTRTRLKRGKEYTGPPPMTSSELIAHIRKLDPTGKMPVALRSGGGEVRPVDEVSTDTLLGCSPESIDAHPENRFFAMLKRYSGDLPKKLGLIEKYKVIFID